MASSLVQQQDLSASGQFEDLVSTLPSSEVVQEFDDECESSVTTASIGVMDKPVKATASSPARPVAAVGVEPLHLPAAAAQLSSPAASPMRVLNGLTPARRGTSHYEVLDPTSSKSSPPRESVDSEALFNALLQTAERQIIPKEFASPPRPARAAVPSRDELGIFLDRLVSELTERS